jgi:hemerythrin
VIGAWGGCPMLAKWKDDYCTGHVLVDAQHRELFELLNAFSEAIVARRGREMVGPALARLVEYASEHFAAEERLMRTSCYPGLASHVHIHEEFRAQVQKLARDYDRGEVVLALTLSQFMLDWLALHIKGEDQRLVRWLRQETTAEQPGV